ncbi:hypothetical protein B0H21DRAFT_824465 [Amylocystis lapponica]|nr:hypothetical protein B0H21DRAFT_826666 [Amylocystis lapponica]KAH9941473.1 hypothetical protein B0H21DRAFT_824465 [Amylocystis lapponica]
MSSSDMYSPALDLNLGHAAIVQRSRSHSVARAESLWPETPDSSFFSNTGLDDTDSQVLNHAHTVSPLQRRGSLGLSGLSPAYVAGGYDSPDPRAQVLRLTAENEALRGSHEELTRAYTGLLQVVSALQATGAKRGDDPTTGAEDDTAGAEDDTVVISAATKSRYGQAKFTTREKFMAWLKGARGASEINVARKESGEGQEGADDDSGGRQCCYLEDDQGCTVSRARIDRMRDHARAIWNLFAENNRAPSTWSQAPLDVRNEFRTEMVSRFPELRLCEDDWKTDYLAMKNYPHWHKRRYPKTPVIKDEHQVHGRASRAKRTATSLSPADLEDLAEPTAKKVKVAGTESTHDGIATAVVVDEGEGPDLMAKVPGTEPTLQNGIAAHPVVDKGKRPALVLKNALSGLFKVSSPGVDTGPLPDEPTGAGNSDTPGILTSDTIDSTPTASSVDVPAPQMDGRIDVPPTCEPKTPPDALLPATSTSSVKQSPEQPTTKSGSAKAGATNVKVYKPSLSTTARNLCGIEWKKKNPTGTTEDFANYYNGLLPGARKAFVEQSKQLKAAAKLAAPGDNSLSQVEDSQEIDTPMSQGDGALACLAATAAEVAAA